MMTDDGEFFRGDVRDTTSPLTFLRLFRHKMMFSGTANTGDAWVKLFRDWIDSDSPAETWYAGLLSQHLADWTAFELEFLTHWQPVRAATKSASDWQREMLAYRLKEEELGQQETMGNREVYSHVRWAAHILDLAGRAGIAASPHLIFLVRDQLPDIVKEFVAETHANWSAFCTTVSDLNVNTLRDRLEAKRGRAAEIALLQEQVERLQAQISTRAIANLSAQISRMSYNPQPPAAPGIPTRVSPAVSNAATPRPSTPQLPNPPQNVPQAGERRNATESPMFAAPTLTPEQRNLLRASIAALPHHPNTDAGIAAYHAQLAHFAATHGNRPYIDERLPVPLRPGTAPLRSGECFRCGIITNHRAGNCRVPLDQQLPRNEIVWRSFCTRFLGIEGNGGPRVQLVTSETEFAPRISWADQLALIDEQGNGSGLPA
ncbi:hypothetical protein EWM64_g7551 [Hericium alpestre]|uniref:Uncharacterized protein n=1 Tax=Hericium alpestre TaxID=135208 RepID=A0A4Y9ZR07_9AGAM|nr:hypothetical protein EWM64_g7551 [Hericium alpestre]